MRNFRAYLLAFLVMCVAVAAGLMIGPFIGWLYDLVGLRVAMALISAVVLICGTLLLGKALKA